MISYGRQTISDEDINAVVETLRSDFLTQGPKVKKFEDAICNYTGAKFCVAVANGTAALHLAVASLEINAGNEGITSTNTFTASATSMIYNHLKPVFADIDENTFNVTVNSLQSKITDKTALFMPVHFAGQPCEMQDIRKLADGHGIYIIEDAAHGLGSSYTDGDFVGSCKYSDLTIFSFHPVKTITTGEGGAITTNNEVLYKRLLALRSHGITKDSELMEKNPGPWYYEMQSLGFNYRMCDIQAALGISQMKRLVEFKQKRRKIVKRYNRAFFGLRNINIPEEGHSFDSCFHLYVVQLDFESIGISRAEFMQELYSAGVGTQVHYIPVHTQPYYQKNFGTKDDDCPVAIKFYNKALSLPLYPAMTDKDQDLVIESIKKCLN